LLGAGRHRTPACGLAFACLALAQFGERGHQVVVERESPLAVVALGFFDPHRVVDEHPSLAGGEGLVPGLGTAR
jgi:hypothetical protein